jgi:hypothetical protein
MVANLPIGLPLDADQAWEVGRKLLDVLEGVVAERLAKRDPIYWLHIYRRIEVMLSGGHENKTDSLTTAHVRRMVELAIFKHGNEKAKNELWPSNSVSPRLVLGGWLEKAIKHYHTGDKRALKALLESWAMHLKGSSSLVIKDFSIVDLETIYFVEGICYQYWRVSALLRSLGKGALITLDTVGDWTYKFDKDLEGLIDIYDERIEFEAANSLLAGIWLRDPKPAAENLADPSFFRETIVVPFYNIEQTPWEQGLQLPAFSIAPGSLTNFLLSEVSLRGFRDATAFLDEPFERKHGFSLTDLSSTISALSSLITMPERVLAVEDQEERLRLLSSYFLQSLNRGYSISASDGALAARIQSRMELIGSPQCCEGRVESVLDFVSTNPERKSMISLWSGGPRPLIVRTPKWTMFDPVGIYGFFRTLFVGVRDLQNRRGFSFEDQVRADLKESGYEVISGEKRNSAGEKREVDAAIMKGETLYLFECFSAERPMDFELSKPSVLLDSEKTKQGKTKIIPGRNTRLGEKLVQAETLRNFFLTHISGRNYDFSDVKRIEHFVVSPFVEWIWSKDSRFWFTADLPRIISPSEVHAILGEEL